MQAVFQLRLVVGVFYVLGAVSLAIGLGLALIGATWPPASAFVAVGYIFAAWQFSRGSAIAHVVLAIISVISTVLCAVAGLIGREDYPLSAFALFLASAATLASAYFLVFSRQLRTERKARRLLNIAANRRAFERSVSGD
jgi:hypothetical protein